MLNNFIEETYEAGEKKNETNVFIWAFMIWNKLNRKNFIMEKKITNSKNSSGIQKTKHNNM